MTRVPDLDVRPLTTLTPEQAEGVAAVAAAATAADGVAPLSEQTLLSLTAPAGSARHYLGYAAGELHGYAVADVAGGGASVEVVVEPGQRRHGLGDALWRAVEREHPTAKVWAHGDLPAARTWAAREGMVRVRELHKMARALGPDDLSPGTTTLPPGYTARAFRPGSDEQAWLATNAAAFASHPEQGRMTLADLRDRMAQPWFDPEGFIVVEADDAPGEVAAFHWTKVHEGGPHDAGVPGGPHSDVPGGPHDGGVDAAPAHGEVYVVGVHPDHQGRGLARPLTALGLAHLAAQGLTEVVLYVDGDNVGALRTYTGLGFRSIMVDVMYSAAVHH
ncbi:MAG TPA: mycothiol synthase [Pedococcus sp.]